MNNFDNSTELRERLANTLHRAYNAENNAADLAAELQATRTALHVCVESLRANKLQEALVSSSTFLKQRGLMPLCR
jgi:hypothetical protein